jgi:hypothetical protein
MAGLEHMDHKDAELQGNAATIAGNLSFAPFAGCRAGASMDGADVLRRMVAFATVCLAA